MGELIFVRGETDGTSTSGTVSLNSDVFYSAVNYIRIPKGMVAKVWFKKVAGEGETLFILQYTYDCTAASPTWINMQAEKLASKGEVVFDRRKPEIFRSFTGKEAIAVVWSQPTAVKAYIELGIELE
jgi:hypothetical protein